MVRGTYFCLGNNITLMCSGCVELAKKPTLTEQELCQSVDLKCKLWEGSFVDLGYFL